MMSFSDEEVEICKAYNSNLLILVGDTSGEFELELLLSTLINELLEKNNVPTKSAALQWFKRLLEKRRLDIYTFVIVNHQLS